MSILERVNGHEDLVTLKPDERVQLCGEIRQFLIENVSKTGGHLASNLGIVELSVAIETVFDTTKDRLVFDVGHQSYVHKLLTGRKSQFSSLRKLGGMAGFPKPSESDADAFIAGHASESVSVALGMARARTQLGQDYQVIALIGDGASTGGLSFEALNDAGAGREPLIVILNDNEMSINPNVGGIAIHLYRLRMKQRYLGMKKRVRIILNVIPGGKWIYKVIKGIKDRLKQVLIPATIFETMGLSYIGPVDGHNTAQLISALETAKKMACPVVLHVITKKGKGYAPAENDPSRFHGIGSFDPGTGLSYSLKEPDFSSAFGNTLKELAERNDRVCAITAAMPLGTGLQPMQDAFPDRVLDVGIAEEHAVSMAGGMAKQGMIPVVAIYSTFLQRSYDMIFQDVAILRQHVVFAIDRAGIVGEDGETHQGIYDLGFLRQVPGMMVLFPASRAELSHMLCWAVEEYDGPVAIRYPRGGNRGYTGSAWDGWHQVFCHKTGKDGVLITYGVLLENVMAAAQLLEEKGIHMSVLRLLCAKELPMKEIAANIPEGAPVFIAEEIAGGSGMGQELAWQLRQYAPGSQVYIRDLGKQFLTHGSLPDLYRLCGLDSESLADFVEQGIAKNGKSTT